MIYELHTLEDMITSTTNDSHIDETSYEQLINLTNAETERIKKVFRHKVFSFKKEKYAERYIQQHQSYLIGLVDDLLHFLPGSTIDPSVSSKWPPHVQLKWHLYTAIESLLTYIETYFTKYFNLNEKIPESYRQIARQDLSEDTANLKQELNKRSLDTQLVKLVLQPLRSFLSHSREPITFRRLIFLKEFKKELVELIEANPEPASLESGIFTSMVYLNFNSTRFSEYCFMRIKEAYSSKDTLAGQIESLAYFFKRANQVSEKPGFAYIPTLKSLKEQISDWIAEETFFLEKKQQLTLNLSLKRPESDTSNFKLLTELSVPQAAYLVRLFIETGLFKNNNIIEVVRFFAKHIQTKRTENISIESFRSKFYNADRSSRETIKDLLIKLLNQARKPH